MTRRSGYAKSMQVAAVAIAWAQPAHAQAVPSSEAAQTGAGAGASVDQAGQPLPSPPADAQAAPLAQPDVVVTGSRIRGAAPVGSPIVQQSRTDLAESGAINVNGLVQDLPQITNQGVSEANRNTSGGAGNITYGSGFDIHGIGPYATLTLLNGRRLVQSGASGGLPDPNSIPAIALERVEVVADGASAIYGSDAVAGVVNLLTRRTFSGLEATAHYGLSRDEGYNEYQAGIIAGHQWDSGGFMAAFEHSGHAALNGATRSFYGADLQPRGGADSRTSQCSPATVTINGTNYAYPGLAAGTTNLCDPLKSQDLIPSQRRDSVIAALTQKVGSRVTLTADLLYSHREFAFSPGQTNAAVTLPNTNPYFVLPAGVVATSETVGTEFSGQAPVNVSRGLSDLIQGTVGATVKLVGDFQLDGSYSYGRENSLSESVNGVNNGALAVALASTNPATALNPFGTTNPSVINGIFNQIFRAPGTNREQQGNLNLTGSLFSLPGGRVRIAIGGEIVHDSILTGVDTGSPGAVNSLRTYADRTIKSVYGEVQVPIFGPDNAVPGLRRLDLSLAGRISQYSDVGTARNPKIGLNWTPVDGLTLHGSYGTSFRAPVLTQIHGALSALFIQNYQTPAGVVQGVTLSGFANGNPLTPERARTFSLGADLNPVQLPNFHASVNYFDVRYTGQINAVLSDLTILQSPAIAAQYADRIVQGAQAAAVIQSFVSAGYPVLGVLPPNPQLFVYGNNVNAGITLTQGIDFQASYRFGGLRLATNGTLFTRYDTAVSATAPLLDELNAVFYPPRFRTRSSLGWTHGDLDAVLFWNYTNSYHNNRTAPVQPVAAYSTFDLHVGYTFRNTGIRRGGLTLAVDVENMFDKDPPFIDLAESPNGGGGYDPTVTNPVGRIVAITATTRF